jgi:Reverse transcriptase (RNA-dependent DNA polymerase)
MVPFGLSTATLNFQSLMNAVLREFLNYWCIVHVGDIQIHSHTPEECLEHIELVFKKLREYKLYGKLSKCIVMRKELEYLGHVISGEGISVDPSLANKKRLRTGRLPRT